MIKINKKVINKELRRYANKWEKTSEEYDKNNIYDWLLSNVGQEFQSVLEIGCGTGNSTVKLLEKAERIITIDDNIECLNKTLERIKNMNINVSMIKRESLLIKSEKQFSISYSNIDLMKCMKSEVVLIQGDLLNDTNLIDFLKNNFKFDLVACWFIGTNTIKQYNAKINELKITSDPLYRERVQQAVFEVYKDTKSHCGIMQVADRCGENDEKIIENHYNSMFDNNVIEEGIKNKKIHVKNEGGITFVQRNDRDEVISVERENITMNFVSCLIKI